VIPSHRAEKQPAAAAGYTKQLPLFYWIVALLARISTIKPPAAALSILQQEVFSWSII